MIVNNVVYGGPALNVPGHLSYAQYILDKLKENSAGDDVALVNGETGVKTTFKQIYQETVNAANGLKKLGVKRGDVVGICSENRDEYIAAALGVVCCGATITTFNLMYSKDEFQHVLNISRPNLVICSEVALKLHHGVLKSQSSIKNIIQLNGAPLASGILAFRNILEQSDASIYEPAEVEGWTDTVFILYSSGTTGLPKGVMLTHLNALYAAANFEARDTKDDNFSRILSIIPWFHAYGLISTINYLTTKKTLIYFSSFNPQKYLGAIPEYKVNVLIAVPPIVVFLAKAPIVEKYDLSSVNVVWCGAAPLSPETINEALKRMPSCLGIFQAYGMTETSLAATQDVSEETALPKPGSGGYPLPGVKAKVVDIENRRKLGPNQEGEICLKGPVVMKGYVGDEAASRQMIDEEGYLKTGDIGYYDADGCFYVVDRLKELIKYKGYQVPPAALERVILQHSAVAECGVVGAPDEVAGELPTAFVVLKPGAKLTEAELLRFTDERLSSTTRLHGGIIFISEIPKNQSGKILRRALKALLQEKKKSKL
ncbi:4-coumarate--CoA ligase 1-like [Manduca sexta]|uniref:4-coumarate--CoA ligase 1-like n=1 Tax=Manduca sexta TaxID=7130 RepID=UPI00188E0F15|nr:4-coumarate--CoA ligase 1-like [Manduca sexta]